LDGSGSVRREAERAQNHGIKTKMVRKIKYGKIAIVILLTVLIWVWADLDQDQEWPVPKLAISIAKSADPALWASFKGADELPASSVSINNVLLKGPASRIVDVEQRWNRGSSDFGVFFAPEQEQMTSPGEHPLDVLTFLKRTEKIRRWGVTIESCEPKTVVIQIAKLVTQKVAVQCFNESGAPQKAQIKPEKVDAFVPADRTLTAKVRLTASEIKQARSSVITKKPYIEMPDGQIVEVSTDVEITMPPAEDVLRDYTVKAPKLVIALSLNLQGIYKANVSNLNEVIRPFTIRATPEAGQAYEKQPFQMTLFILDGDEKVEGPQTKEVVYNLPEGFVRGNEIEVLPPLARAQFVVVRIGGEIGEGEGL
jgi:hypothetical protein